MKFSPSLKPYRTLLLYVLGLGIFFVLSGVAEQAGAHRRWLGPVFLFGTVMVYAAIGIYCRTTKAEDYYVAGRKIPPFFNGMAAAADWVSAASFISLAGALYLYGFSSPSGKPGGMAYLLGWSGGFCLLGLWVVPYLRRMELYTLPDFFVKRYEERWPRIIAAWAAIACSFVYVVAQIYAVGLIAMRLTGVQFEIGIMLGLGGVLLCSFLGGMRAITWTQVAQYVVMLLAFLIPVSWLSYKVVGNPLAPVVYGQLMEPIAQKESEIMASVAEHQVALVYLHRAQVYAARLDDVDQALSQERGALQTHLGVLQQNQAELSLIMSTSRELADLPPTPEVAKKQWEQVVQDNLQRAMPLGGLSPHTQAFAGHPDGGVHDRELFERSRRNFLALVFCLMIGTIGMPHLLTRYYTTPSVAAARTSVAWTFFFVVLLYLSLPALATLVKHEVLFNLVGSRFDALPAWVMQWNKLDASLITIHDVNGDGVVQLGEMRLGADLIMLAAPELGGLPYVVSGLVAAGGFAAALSTADGLLLTISNALVRDLHWSKLRADHVTTEHVVIFSKFVLFSVAILAALAAAYKAADILPLVSVAFSLAGATLVPAMILGMMWRGANSFGAVVGMLAGAGVTLYYQMINAEFMHSLFKINPQPHLWWDIDPAAAGVFGIPVGFLCTWWASWAWTLWQKLGERRRVRRM